MNVVILILLIFNIFLTLHTNKNIMRNMIHLDSLIRELNKHIYEFQEQVLFKKDKK